MTIELFAPLKNLFQVEFNVDEDRKKEKTEEISESEHRKQLLVAGFCGILSISSMSLRSISIVSEMK